MADLYKGNPSQYGGFNSPIPGGSSNRGYYQQPFNLPFTTGRSILASIPEYQRNPLLLEKDLIFKVSEGRANLMRIILEQIERGGGVTVNDVRFRLPIEIEPNQRIYLDAQSATAGAVNSSGLATFKIRGNRTPISTAHPAGAPNQVGDIARIEVGQFLLCMFSWVEPRRRSTVSGTSTVFYSPNAAGSAPVPEIWKVVSVDYANSRITVQRNWAGEQRTSFTYNTTTIPNVEILADNSTDSPVWGVTGAKVPAKYAFVVPMAKSVKEDEIDAKIRNFSGTWTYGLLQRHLLAWGSQYFAEVISSNMGIESPLAKSKRYAIKDYYDFWEMTALFGEKSETFDPATNYWEGTTDGILSNIPKSHYVTLKGIDYTAAFTSGSNSNFGSFHPVLFNKIMEGMPYIGSQEKVLVCGSAFHTAFSTMINFMTQSVPSIQSEWKVEGKKFTTSNGLVINVVPSDKMSLNGLSHSAIMYDSQYFKPVSLKNYPGADIYEIQNENPLKKNGFIHGVKGFIDLNPDAHWIFTVQEKQRADGTDDSAAYNALSPLGSFLG